MSGGPVARACHLLADMLLASGLGPDRQALAALARARTTPVPLPPRQTSFEVTVIRRPRADQRSPSSRRVA